MKFHAIEPESSSINTILGGSDAWTISGPLSMVTGVPAAYAGVLAIPKPKIAALV
ncbi:hypothetical protein [Dyella sp. 20L07]|uniref:hypothetical protein n=1 Tax=Dyella sp. 20L07 TaxID=3384240 RepID=UPI003D2D263D